MVGLVMYFKDYLFYKFGYTKALFSPFKPFRLEWYFGEVAIGTPYFLPRKWVKTEKGQKGVPKKIGFDIVGLGWKTKWHEKDFRFEWSPLISFVFFGYQIAVTVRIPEDNDYQYWEAWLYYELITDKKKSKSERIKECKEKFPLTYTSGDGIQTNYYEKILKTKYLN